MAFYDSLFFQWGVLLGVIGVAFLAMVASVPLFDSAIPSSETEATPDKDPSPEK